MSVIDNNYHNFIEEIKNKIAISSYKAALQVNRDLILLYHHIGKEILKHQHQHGWGAKIIDNLSKDLRNSFPEMKGFSTQNLKYMRRFAEEYSLDEIGQQAIDQLPWGHNITLIYKVEDKIERIFYIQKTLENGWSRSILEIQIGTNLYKRQGQAINNFLIFTINTKLHSK